MATGGAIKKINNSSRERETTQDDTHMHTHVHTHVHTHALREGGSRGQMCMFMLVLTTAGPPWGEPVACVCSLPYLSTKA